MSRMCQLLLLSNSTLHGSGYLEWAENYIKKFLKRNNVKSIVFVPYALKDQASYTQKVRSKAAEWGYTVLGLNEAENPAEALSSAEAIFIGGGNTFLLLKTLYDNQLLAVIRQRVLKDGVPYIGSSAGTNVATTSICTTNDMPIVYPPSFQALQLVPFNINPHYLDADVNSTHKGETREQRIGEYHEQPDAPPVVGLREGSLLAIDGNTVLLQGNFPLRLFRRNLPPKEYDVGSDLSFLLQ